MKLGLILPYEGSLSFADALQLTQRAEARGFDSVWMPEAYGTDAISILGALAARTERIRLGTGIVNVFSRTPALLAHPVRATVPIFLATLSPAGLRLTGELADGWMPTLFSPEHMDVFRPELEAGARAAGRPLASLVIAPHVPVMVDDDRSRARDAVRPWVALYVGGMGSRKKNFYNEVVTRYGYAEEARVIQDLYLTGKQREAIRQVPDALVDAITIAGPAGYVRDRLAAWSAAGVSLLVAAVHGKTQDDRLQTVEILSAATADVH